MLKKLLATSALIAIGAVFVQSASAADDGSPLARRRGEGHQRPRRRRPPDRRCRQGQGRTLRPEAGRRHRDADQDRRCQSRCRRRERQAVDQVHHRPSRRHCDSRPATRPPMRVRPPPTPAPRLRSTQSRPTRSLPPRLPHPRLRLQRRPRPTPASPRPERRSSRPRLPLRGGPGNGRGQEPEGPLQSPHRQGLSASRS